MTARYEAFDWYEVPLYYDIVFEEDTELEGRFLETMLERYAEGTGRRILEPACGSGRLVAEMARRGYQVTGFDLSDPSLQFARQRLQRQRHKAKLVVDDMRGFSFPATFDLAHCLVSTFKYLLTEADAEAHLRQVARALRPGGLYVLGFHLSDYDETGLSRERWVGQRGDTHVTCNIQSWPPLRRKRLERVRSRLVVEHGESVRRLETSWWFRTYNAAQFRRLLKRIPELEHVATYDFCYDVDQPLRFSDDQLDNVVILRRRPPG